MEAAEGAADVVDSVTATEDTSVKKKKKKVVKKKKKKEVEKEVIKPEISSFLKNFVSIGEICFPAENTKTQLYTKLHSISDQERRRKPGVQMPS